jgi:hypothetical protein
MFGRRQVIPLDYKEENDGSLCCWNDGEPFKGRCVHIPVMYDEETYTVQGLFCSLGCAKQYIIDHRYREDVCDIFERMSRQVYQQKNIQPNGPPYILKKYCGPLGMDIETYRARHHVVLPKHVIMKREFEALHVHS